MDLPKELTEEQKVKQDLTKNLQKNLQNMERDQRIFIRLATLDKSKVPANLPPLLIKYHKLNNSCISSLINTLDEIKPLDPNDVDTDKYQKVVDKSSEARDEYMEYLKIGET